VVFSGNVVASQNSSTQWADRMEVYLDDKGDNIVRTVSTGNVRIVTKDCRNGTAKRAEYYDAEQRVVLIGNARVWRDDNVVTGERITIYLAEDRAVVEGGPQERVKAVFYPHEREANGARGPDRRPRRKEVGRTARESSPRRKPVVRMSQWSSAAGGARGPFLGPRVKWKASSPRVFARRSGAAWW
jgi:lipopolysaccharide export system protein LptA